MDYCSSCRRHLNGALVCPGCGAYAPDIAPTGMMTTGSAGTGTTTGSLMLPTVPAATATPATWEYAAPDDMWHDGHAPLDRHGPMDGHLPSDGHAPLDEFAPEPTGVIEPAHAGALALTEAGTPGAGDVAGESAGDGHGDADGYGDVDHVNDLDGVPPAPQGRAARRRQLARWKKNQRRAVVATAVALVGGGLTVMGMDRQSTDRTQAATAPDADTLGGLEEQGSQGTRTPSTHPDDVRRSSDSDSPAPRSPSTGLPYDRSAAQGTDSHGNGGTSSRTTRSIPSTQQSRTGSSTTSDGTTTEDTAADTPSTEATTPPATDDNSGTGTGTDTGTDTSTGTDTGSGTDTGASDGSTDTSDATSPSGLCLLGGVICVT
ncbi:SCO2400 family protein [Streptomyces ipomoeae]|uniref:SCO2400 family protein n=1 Tax=Streptomyces ipomoeae TaxID=103232 RepID=UPI0011478825|nr:hypothetical protein [Streptomyces ipomoeae]MDX2938701.1 hypothetical protein [Streptomyces ipomoeae]TQE14433.1 hypothetical protein SipoB123_47445 [Streptomyces ipomoeae]